ncbi:MAG TPA: hypothetical protein VFH00_00405 [Candidatus Nitrosotalea sp.]|nr:hypothetical protein [Candidatus Nitrosotalea sp.]
MRNLLRKPLTWIVIGECIVVGVLLVVVWNVVAASVMRHAVGAPFQIAEAPPNPSSSRLPDVVPVTKPASRPQLPGLNLDTGFWRNHLSLLNREQVILEQIEWRVVHNAMNVIRRYLETVVLPSINRAERGSG